MLLSPPCCNTPFRASRSWSTVPTAHARECLTRLLIGSSISCYCSLSRASRSAFFLCLASHSSSGPNEIPSTHSPNSRLLSAPLWPELQKESMRYKPRLSLRDFLRSRSSKSGMEQTSSNALTAWCSARCSFDSPRQISLGSGFFAVARCAIAECPLLSCTLQLLHLDGEPGSTWQRS